ncbi:hypothetical protein AGRA3207_007883 (plasmid) [Actinomadura graeca]|uniref:Uncharacterized protein n=1 Tax=Actinomadura graeca TaxID=2750812 RepID=A0ABX8R7M9_9ACTN|nr:hypothetical protein [Actinomadura graeca]QXJ27085.1 hypothetical protein AGRA3207_007883 [Actinomadura graeca]
MTPPKNAGSRGAADKAAALSRGRQARRPGPAAPPATPPLPDMPAPPPAPSPTSATPAAPSRATPATPAGRAPDGHGRRGHLRKMSLEMTPDEHDRLKVWLVNAFGGDTRATPVLKALLAEAYTDPALTDRIRRRLDT